MTSPTRLPGSARDPLWYKDATMYALHVKTFFDANGDGVGDFEGLIGKLDYLASLGVTCLWLLPFYESPLRTTDTTSPTTNEWTRGTVRSTTSSGSSRLLTRASCR